MRKALPVYAGKRRVLQCVIGWLAALLLAPAFAQGTPAGTQDTGAGAQKTLLVMGDSLSAGYGMSANEGWVALLERRLAAEKPGWRVVNASISGETTAGGAARIVGDVVYHRPDVVIIELGGNDGLRGLPLHAMRLNLARMIGASQHVGAKVLLVGMQMPPNLGPDYTRGFEKVYTDLSELFGTALLPFFLAPVAADRGNFQDDNIHPTADVQPRLLEHVWPALAPLLD